MYMFFCGWLGPSVLPHACSRTGVLGVWGVRVSAPRFGWGMKRVCSTRVLRSGLIRVLVSPRAQM